MSGARVSSTRSLIPISWCFVFGNNTKKWKRDVVCYTEQCSKCVMLNCGIKLVKPGIKSTRCLYCIFWWKYGFPFECVAT